MLSGPAGINLDQDYLTEMLWPPRLGYGGGGSWVQVRSSPGPPPPLHSTPLGDRLHMAVLPGFLQPTSTSGFSHLSDSVSVTHAFRALVEAMVWVKRIPRKEPGPPSLEPQASSRRTWSFLSPGLALSELSLWRSSFSCCPVVQDTETTIMLSCIFFVCFMNEHLYTLSWFIYLCISIMLLSLYSEQQHASYLGH